MHLYIQYSITECTKEILVGRNDWLNLFKIYYDVFLIYRQYMSLPMKTLYRESEEFKMCEDLETYVFVLC